MTEVMPMIVDRLEELDAAWFTSALRARGVIGDDDGVTAAQVSPFGTGQWGLVGRALLEYAAADAGGPPTVIVKVPAEDATAREFGRMTGGYEAEVRFYKEILPRVGVRAPRLLWGEIEPSTARFTLVLEDLSSGWEVGDMIAGGTVEQTAAALEQLAQLQAPLWNDAGLRDLAWLAPIERTQAFFDVIGPALPAFLERFGHHLPLAQRELVERLAPKAHAYPGLIWREPLVVMHGDFRLDNLLFAEQAGRLHAAVIDWQSVRVGPPLVDVAIYFATCLEPELRRVHQDELLRGYHDRLVAHGVRDFSLQQCRDALRQAAPYTFLLGVGASVTLTQTDRGDAMFASLMQRSAQLVEDLGAEDILA